MTREEALNEIRSWAIPSEKGREVLETLIPELAESEDERIRKEILNYVLYKADGVSEEDEHRWVTWLEKQKDLDKMIVVSPEVWDNAISEAYENGEKDGEKQKEQKPEGWSNEFEENIRELLYNKLRWDSEDGRISTAVFIDDKTLKDIVTGIWFYVGKEAMKNPNMELPKQEWSNEDEEKLKAICTYLRDYSRLAKINDVKRFNAYCDWLKSLPINIKKKNEDVAKLCSNGWSKEDEEVMEDLYNFVISDFIQGHIHEARWKPWKTTLERNRQNRLKSIRPSWKPSEEQMEEPEYYQHFDPDC